MKEMNVFMVLKPHFHELKKFEGSEEEYTNIIFALTEDFADAYNYLPGVDLLISDYSSVLVDFLCANKPIIIFDYDINDYIIHDAGLDDTYFNLDFGPRCKTWEEVLVEVDSQLKNDSWKNKRKKSLEYTNLFNDGLNCERIFVATKKLINDVAEEKKFTKD